MGIRKAACVAFMAVAAACALWAQDSRADGNLLENPGFEGISADGTPEGWRTDEWTKGDTDFSVREGNAAEGSRFFSVESRDEDDAKLIQTVSVKPNSYYRFSAMIRASGLRQDRKGAYISVLGIMDGSPDVHESKGEWTPVSFYGKTGKSQKQLDFCLRLGGYSSTTAGSADFDQTRAEKVDKLPAGVAAAKLEADKPKAKASSIPSSDPLAIFLALLGFCGLVYFLDRSKAAGAIDSGRAARVAFWSILAAAALIRLPFCLGGYGYGIDVNNFRAWGDQALKSRIAFFYRDVSFADYPPGYVYVLAVTSAIRAVCSFGYDSPLGELLIRLPALACDFLIGAALYRFVGKKSGKSRGLLACALFLLNPLTIQDSAVWGQVDSVFTLAIVLSLCALSDKRLLKAGVLYGVAALLKPQAFIFAPVFLCAYISRRRWKAALWSVLAGLGVLFAGFLPFIIVHGPLFPFKLYAETLSSYAYASFNGANLWGLMGMNLKPITEAFLGLPISAWGTVAVAAIGVLSFPFFFLMRKKSEGGEDPVFETAAFLILSVFTLSVKMHERYLYPLFPILLFAWASRSGMRLPLFSLLASFASFLNVSLAYRLALGKTYHIPPGDALFLACSALNVASLALFFFVILPEPKFSRADRDRAEPSAFRRRLADPRGFEALGGDGSGDKRGGRFDALVLSLLCLACLLLALCGLGDFKVPERGWKAASVSESAILDLGQEAFVDSISWYSGIGDGEFSIRFSPDGKEWSAESAVAPSLYSWKNQACGLKARYAELKPRAAGANMLELAFWGKEGKAPLQARPSGPGPGSLLVDEQALAKAHAGYMDSMYFDEIYFGRTAYEHIHSLEPYEWTHPPLGKLIISLGIRLFGMSPFGWRVMGALFGVLLVPAFYALARLAFPKGRFALGAAALYALDFMRYTQTRMGTVDGYVVFFVIASYLFMYRYYLSALAKDGTRPDYVSLGLCGLAFGLGAATKWNAIYSGAGLAIVFFIAFIRRLRADLGDPARKPPRTWLRASGVVLFCVLCFILVPIGIYVAAYVPTLSVPGHDWGSIWRYQGQMYNYHSKLVAEHAFSSPWWQWWMLVRPVWYFKAEGLAAGWTSTIVAHGNPLIWWPSLACAVAAIFIALKRRDDRFLPIILGFFAQYLPWVLVPRLTFLYHYFPAIPFALLCILYCMRAVIPQPLATAARGGKKAARAAKASGTGERLSAFLADNWLWVYVGSSLVLFLWFLPALSGARVPLAWISSLKWLPSWIF